MGEFFNMRIISRLDSVFFRCCCLGFIVAMSGCTSTGVVCQANTAPCENGCVDTFSDRRHCGACGRACGDGQECVASACVCLSGSTLCEGNCVQLSFDTQNCGRCGNVCGNGQSCDKGECKVRCDTLKTVRCGSLSCVDVLTDAANCGGCGLQCQSGESCRGGQCTVDVAVACFNTGQLAGFAKDTFRKTPLQPVGKGPQSLAVLGATLLVADTIDGQLYQSVASAPGLPAGQTRPLPLLGQRPERNQTGAASNHVLVDKQLVYVTNSAQSTMQVLTGTDAGTALQTVGEVSFGMNAFPQVAAAAGDDVWVSLYGDATADSSDAGQRVVRVSVKDPKAPAVTESVSLKSLDLKPFSNAPAIARPTGLVSHLGNLYVALNNLTADYQPAGPGILAKIDIVTKQVTAIDLGLQCLNPGWVVVARENLLVSCTGNYGPAPSGAGP
jgi:Stigma-specific protein, Stig1